MRKLFTSSFLSLWSRFQSCSISSYSRPPPFSSLINSEIETFFFCFHYSFALWSSPPFLFENPPFSSALNSSFCFAPSLFLRYVPFDMQIFQFKFTYNPYLNLLYMWHFSTSLCWYVIRNFIKFHIISLVYLKWVSDISYQHAKS